MCSNTFGCIGIEYFRKSGARNAEDTFEEGNCNLSSSHESEGCNAERWQMFLWKKAESMDCKKWKNQKFDNVAGEKDHGQKYRERFESLVDNGYYRPTTENRINGGT